MRRWILSEVCLMASEVYIASNISEVFSFDECEISILSQTLSQLLYCNIVQYML